MQATMTRPVAVLPAAMDALHGPSAAAADSGLPATTIDLVHLRASQTDHYDEEQLAGLLVAISAINAWNGLNAATRQIAGRLGG
jgi:alkylhydroperoxidase family enzyme